MTSIFQNYLSESFVNLEFLLKQIFCKKKLSDNKLEIRIFAKVIAKEKENFMDRPTFLYVSKIKQSEFDLDSRR
jgi:hypothetical protein